MSWTFGGTCWRKASSTLYCSSPPERTSCWNEFPRCSTVICRRYFQRALDMGLTPRVKSSTWASNSYTCRTNGSLPVYHTWRTRKTKQHFPFLSVSGATTTSVKALKLYMQVQLISFCYYDYKRLRLRTYAYRSEPIKHWVKKRYNYSFKNVPNLSSSIKSLEAFCRFWSRC